MAIVLSPCLDGICLICTAVFCVRLTGRCEIGSEVILAMKLHTYDAVIGPATPRLIPNSCRRKSPWYKPIPSWTGFRRHSRTKASAIFYRDKTEQAWVKVEMRYKRGLLSRSKPIRTSCLKSPPLPSYPPKQNVCRQEISAPSKPWRSGQAPRDSQQS